MPAGAFCSQGAIRGGADFACLQNNGADAMVHERRRAFRFRVPRDQQRVEVALESKPHEVVPAVLLDESATGFGVLIPRLPVRAENYLLLHLPAGWVRTRVIHVEPGGDQLRVGLQLVEELFSPEEESPLEESVPLVRGDRVQGLWSWWQGAVLVVAIAVGMGALAWSVRSSGSSGALKAQSRNNETPPAGKEKEKDAEPTEARAPSSNPQSPAAIPAASSAPDSSQGEQILSPLEQQLAMHSGPAVLLYPEIVPPLELSPRQKEMIQLLVQEAQKQPDRFHRLSLFLRAWSLLTPEQRRRWRQWTRQAAAR